jgi:hypothetical protein
VAWAIYGATCGFIEVISSGLWFGRVLGGTRAPEGRARLELPGKVFFVG